MTYPTVAVVTTNADAGTDSPATFRSDILDAMQKLNQMIAHTSTFIATLLDDVDQAAARATLGAAAAGALGSSGITGAAGSGANADITSMTGLSNGGIPTQKLASVAFRAFASGNQTAGSQVLFGSVYAQSGGTNYSTATSKFTVPVTGWYEFGTVLDITNTTGSTVSFSIQIFVGPSGTVVTTGGVGAVVQESLSIATLTSVSTGCSCLVYLTAGDLAEVRTASLSANFFVNATTSSFTGRLVGV